MKKSILILLVLFSSQLGAQSIILDLLFGQSENVFKGKVEQIRYSTSNAQGSNFGLTIKVEQFYKGNNQYEEVGFGVLKPDVIDLELDTMVMDYSFQIREGSSYIFFTNKISHLEKSSGKSGVSRFSESKIEGVPFSKGLERQIKAYDKFTLPKASNSYNQSNFAFRVMESNSGSIFLGEVLEISKVENQRHKIKVSTKSGDKSVLTKGVNCICREGEIEIGNQYVFYTNKDETGIFRLVDEWLGIIEAGEYDKVKFQK